MNEDREPKHSGRFLTNNKLERVSELHPHFPATSTPLHRSILQWPLVASLSSFPRRKDDRRIVCRPRCLCRMRPFLHPNKPPQAAGPDTFQPNYRHKHAASPSANHTRTEFLYPTFCLYAGNLRPLSSRLWRPRTVSGCGFKGWLRRHGDGQQMIFTLLAVCRPTGSVLAVIY